MIKVAPSILSADFAHLADEIKRLDGTNADYIHIDVMDGQFVPNITIGSGVVSSIRKYTNKIFDVHLMVQEPEKMIEDFVNAGADIITIHYESTLHIDRVLNLIRNMGKKSGISLIPSTSPDVIDYIMDKLDLILVMTVNPGFGGQKFLESQLDKIRIIREKIDNSNYNIDLEVDGGINEVTAKKAIACGANILVSGASVFSKGYNFYQENIDKLRLANR